MRRVRVIKAHTSEFPNPIRVGAGTAVSVEESETLWQDWLWCRTSDGVEGWVPAAYVDRKGDSGTLRRDYDATELTVAVGGTLEVLEEECGWLRCQT